MIHIYVNGADVEVLSGETLTSGRVGLKCRFKFDRVWDGLDKTIVFSTESSKVSTQLDDDGLCNVPSSILAKPRQKLYVGVYGTDGSNVVISTVKAEVGIIVQGTEVN